MGGGVGRYIVRNGRRPMWFDIPDKYIHLPETQRLLDAERAFEELKLEYDTAISEDQPNSEPRKFSALLYHRMIAQQEFESALKAFKEVMDAPLTAKLSAHVLSAITQDYSENERQFVAEALSRMVGKIAGLRERQYGRERICFCVLQLAAGSRAALEQYVDLAIVDWRDVILAAEYPRRSRGKGGS